MFLLLFLNWVTVSILIGQKPIVYYPGKVIGYNALYMMNVKRRETLITDSELKTMFSHVTLHYLVYLRE